MMTDQSWHIPDPHSQPEFYSDVPLKRLIAFVVDTVLIAILSVVLLSFTAFVGVLFLPLFMLIVGFGYRVTTIANGSATWGMRLMAIEFRTLSGEKFDLQMAFLHTLGLTVSFMLPFLQAASVVLMLTTERGQGLSDLLLGTVAVNRRAGS